LRAKPLDDRSPAYVAGRGAPTIEGQKVVEEINRSFSDSIAGNGRGWGTASGA
jgi:hypothetical protein